MSLVSMTYITNQQHAELPQFETKGRSNGRKPIFLRHLRTFGGLRPGRRAGGGTLRRRLSKVERNELGLVSPTENRTGKITPQKHASSAKRNSRRQGDRAHDDAQKNDVHQQVGDVVLLVEVCVLVPGNADIPVHRTQKRLRVALGKRASSDCDDRPRALIEKWTNIFDGCNPRLRLSGMMGSINAAQMFRSQR